MKKLTKEGWTEAKPENNIRSIRDKRHGLFGQEVWYQLEEAGFVHKDGFKHKRTKEGMQTITTLTPFERKLKNWLIWGYWEK